jgi:hypothetical protein
VTAVELYIEASGERDPEKRRLLVEACFAATGRFVTRSRVFVGPHAGELDADGKIATMLVFAGPLQNA